VSNSSSEYRIPFGKKEIVADFSGGSLSSDGGHILLGQADRKLGLTAKLAECIKDSRDSRKVKQSTRDMLVQRIFGIACGYEDCNDFDELRSDPMLKLSADRDPVSGEDLASQPTLSRLENSVTARELFLMEGVLASLFIERHEGSPPRRIVLDADATDDPTHGQQEFEFFHGYYDCHCYLPLLVYATADDGEQELLAAVLRPGNVHAGHRVVSVVRRIVSRLVAAFPQTEIVFRGDAGMALPEVYDWCEDAGILYVISLPKNSRLLGLAEEYLYDAEATYEETGEKVRSFGEFSYAAETWRHERRVVVKAEVAGKGENPRFVVTNIGGPDAEDIYEFYIDRGDVENRIKELKGDLLSGKTSCHRFLANQFRLLLHAAAFVLVQAIRKALWGTELAAAQAATIRAKLLKVGARVKETTRRVWVKLPTSYPYQRAWEIILTRLTPACI
jgi:hypothetical protein